MKNIYTNKYDFARALFAFALFITLIFNNKYVIFSERNISNQRDVFLDNINLFKLFGFDNIHFSYTIAIIVLMLVILQIAPQINGILQWWVTYSFFYSSELIEGGDQIAIIFTLFLIPVTILDYRPGILGQKIIPPKIVDQINNGIIFILKIQAALLYLEAGIGKIFKTKEWEEGTALYYWMNDELFGRGDFLIEYLNIILESPIGSFTLNHGVIVLEIILFGVLFSNDQKLKSIVFVVAFLFHLGTMVFFGLTSFFLNMTAVLIIYLTDLKTPFQTKKIKYLSVFRYSLKLNPFKKTA